MVISPSYDLAEVIKLSDIKAEKTLTIMSQGVGQFTIQF